MNDQESIRSYMNWQRPKGIQSGSIGWESIYGPTLVKECEWVVTSRCTFSNSHHWFCQIIIGLAAPLLGAPGPLRSVLSGENMGLPFTEEEARGLELCEYYTLFYMPMIYLISNALSFMSCHSVWLHFQC